MSADHYRGVTVRLQGTSKKIRTMRSAIKQTPSYTTPQQRTHTYPPTIPPPHTTTHTHDHHHHHHAARGKRVHDDASDASRASRASRDYGSPTGTSTVSSRVRPPPTEPDLQPLIAHATRAATDARPELSNDASFRLLCALLARIAEIQRPLLDAERQRADTIRNRRGRALRVRFTCFDVPPHAQDEPVLQALLRIVETQRELIAHPIAARERAVRALREALPLAAAATAPDGTHCGAVSTPAAAPSSSPPLASAFPIYPVWLEGLLDCEHALPVERLSQLTSSRLRAHLRATLDPSKRGTTLRLNERGELCCRVPCEARGWAPRSDGCGRDASYELQPLPPLRTRSLSSPRDSCSSFAALLAHEAEVWERLTPLTLGPPVTLALAKRDLYARAALGVLTQQQREDLIAWAEAQAILSFVYRPSSPPSTSWRHSATAAEATANAAALCDGGGSDGSSGSDDGARGGPPPVPLIERFIALEPAHWAEFERLATLACEYECPGSTHYVLLARRGELETAVSSAEPTASRLRRLLAPAAPWSTRTTTVAEELAELPLVREVRIRFDGACTALPLDWEEIYRSSCPAAGSKMDDAYARVYSRTVSYAEEPSSPPLKPRSGRKRSRPALKPNQAAISVV